MTVVRSVIVAAALTLAGAAAAQQPAFEVAAVKKATPDPASPIGMLPLVLPQLGGGLRASNATLHRLVQTAYGVEDYQVTGGPSWATSDRFDITAKAPNSNATMTDMQPMLRTLLAERFKLKVRTEQRQMPTFALIGAREDGRLGPKLSPSTADCKAVRCGVAPISVNGAFGMKGTGQPVAVIVRLVSQALGRLVVDKTGLAGLYDFELAFDMGALAGRAAQQGIPLPPESALPPSPNPALATALQEQLGLRLDSQTSAVQIVVIEIAELPVTD